MLAGRWGAGKRLAWIGRGESDFGGVVRAKAFALTAPGQPVFGDLRRWNGVEWKRGPVERRWNGAEWNRLESAKSGPSPADVSLKAAFCDSSAVQGSRGRAALAASAISRMPITGRLSLMKPVTMGKVTGKPF